MKDRVRYYRKRPVVVRAVRYVGENRAYITAHFTGLDTDVREDGLYIWNTKEGQWLRCPEGHWVMEGVDQEYYPCAPDVFARTYDVVEFLDGR